MKPLSLGSRIGSPANARFTQCVLDAINVENAGGRIDIHTAGRPEGYRKGITPGHYIAGNTL